MGSIVKWAKFGNWSGPYIKGTIPYVLPTNPTGFDIIVAAVAKPEGGAYDTVVAYDGTAVTYGLLQWTFTSGRLHKLLAATAKAMVATASSASYWYPFGNGLKVLTDLRVNIQNGHLYLGEERVTDFFKLRHICTPPNGRCPKSGPCWEKAKSIALLFSGLGENPSARKVQIDFFQDELKRAITPPRPQMGGQSIADFLYAYNGWEESSFMPYLVAARALFFGMWQNAPAKAQAILGKTVGCDLTTERGFEALARRFAYTTFGRWGVEKAKLAEKPYTSRYQKVATAINGAVKQKIVPEYWK